MKVRRVVTGRTPDGRSVFVSDEQQEPVTVDLLPGMEFHRLWGSDDVPVLPTDGAPTPQVRYFPEAGGFRWGIVTWPPASASASADLDVHAALAEAAEKLPGFLEPLERDDPGMHTTETVDTEIVLSGEIVLELDDGAEVTLRAGDTVVQNGTRHRWHNRGDVPAVVAVLLVGARHL